MQRKILIAVIIIIPILISTFVSILIVNKPKKTVSQDQRVSQPSIPSPSPQIVAGLEFPTTNATSSEIDAFYSKASAKAQNSGEITLSSCNMNPDIIKIAPNKTIVIKNTDTKTRIIHIGRDNSYTVSARGTISVATNFGSGIGTYGVHCDNSKKPVGIIVLMQEEANR